MSEVIAFDATGTPQVVPDRWEALAAPGDLAAVADEVCQTHHATTPLLLPLAVWRAGHDVIAAARPAACIGIWLEGHDDPALIANDLPRLGLIAVRFETFKDGRGYSTAYLLRQRYAYRGPLRAIGDVLRDQLHALRRVGFDSFRLADPAQSRAALAAFRDFSEHYQGSIAPALPPYWRRGAVRSAA